MTSSRTRLATLRTRLTRGRTLRQVLRNRDGAIDLASIMVGVIVIAIIAGILLASVFVVIPWTQDNVARQDLDAVRTAEGVWRAQADDITFTDYATLLAAHKIQSAPRVNAATDAAKDCYVAVSGSTTGNVFWNSSVDPSVRLYKSGDTSDCAGVDLGGLVGKLPTGDGPVAVGGGSTSSGTSGSTSGGTTSGTPTAYMALTDSTAGGVAYLDAVKADGTRTSVDVTNEQNPLNTQQDPGVNYNGKFYFTARNSSGLAGLYASDGNTVTEISNPTDYFVASKLTVWNGKLYFNGSGTSEAAGLYVYDGTSMSVIPNSAGITSSGYYPVGGTAQFVPFNGKLYMLRYTDSTGASEQLYSFDGSTLSEVGPLFVGNPSNGAVPRDPFVAGNHLYITGPTAQSNGQATQWSLFAYDGTTATNIADMGAGTDQPFVANGNVYVNSGIVRGGTASLSEVSGTNIHQLTDPNGKPITDGSGNISAIGNTVYFNAWGHITQSGVDVSVYGIWGYAGGSDNPATVAAIIDSRNSDVNAVLGSVGGKIYLNYYGPDSGGTAQLYSFDGSTISLAATINPSGDSSPTYAGTVGNSIVFDAIDATGNDSLFTYDGTTLHAVGNDHVYASPLGVY